MGDDAVQQRRNADADKDQPRPAYSALVRQQVDEQRDSQADDNRHGRDRNPAKREEHYGDHGSGTSAGADADDVRAGQVVPQHGLVSRSRQAERQPGASFTVGRLRLPRAVLSVGLAGAAYQTMLRNNLASPDIIGISASASAGAVVAIVFFSLGGVAVSTVSIVVSLAVALLIYLLSYKGGVSGTRLILVGIGIAALLDSVIAHSLNQAADWNLQEAMRWLSGSVNGASWSRILPVLLALPVFGGLLLSRQKDLEVLRMGDDVAASLGVCVTLTRVVVLVAATVLVAFATAAAGPVSFAVSYTHLRAHETDSYLVCRLLLEKK